MAEAYDFTKSGTGVYSVEPSNRFIVVDDDGNPQDFHATVGNTVKVKFSGDLPASRVHDKRANPGSCSGVYRQPHINTAAKNAHTYANFAYGVITRTTYATAQYSTWFGLYDKDRRDIVKQHFESINGNNFSKFTYDCTCTDAGVLAYVRAYTLQS